MRGTDHSTTPKDALDALVADDARRRVLGRRARQDAEPYSATRWAARLAAIWAAA